MRLGGRLRPEEISAAFTRSPASLIALSGRPTMTTPGGMPLVNCACTSTGTASMPWNATV